MSNSRKRILCIIDREEEVIFGTISYEKGREHDNSIAVIIEDGEDDPIRISEWDVLEVTDAPEDIEPPEDNMTDAEADADTLRSCGWGTDEDYGYYGDDGGFY
jgi:hypothetical protein